MNSQVSHSKPRVGKEISLYVALLHQRMTQQLKEISSPFEAPSERRRFCDREQASLEKAISRRFS